MKKIAATLALACMSTLVWASTSKEEVTDRLNTAGTVLQQIMQASDKGIPEEVMTGAKCVAVVPRMLKGGFVFGANHGKGVATCRLSTGGWSAPAFFTITGGSWGAQIGVEGVDLVMLFMNDKGAKNLIESKFKIGGDASAAAGPVGRHASADTDWKADTEILTYSRAEGLFAGITLNGAYVRPDNDATEALYGKPLTQDEILLGKVAAPAAARPFLNAVQGAKAQARVDKKK